MRTVYKSKYTWWMVAVIAALVVVLPVFMLFEGFDWLLMATTVVYGAFFLDLLLNTSYTIESHELVLRAGVLFRARLDIDKIVSISEKHTCVNDNSYAWSTDRLVISMPRRYKYMVSPTDKDAFIARLKAINPAIKVERAPDAGLADGQH